MSKREEEIKELLKTPELCKIQKFYRYRSMASPEFGGTESRELEGIFVRREIYMPRPIEFNDPFECRPRLNLHMSRLERDRYLKGLAIRELGASDRNIRERFITECKIKLTENPERLAEKPYARFLSETGLYCLSEINDDILMWSHYANGHRGLCLQFDAISDARLGDRMLFGQAIKVIYSEERPICNIYKIGQPKEYQKALLTKSNHWEYEKEWRVIRTPGEGGPGIKPFHPMSLTGVIFGAQISQENKQRVIEWVKRYPTRLSLYQAKINETEFKVDIEPL